MSAAIKAVRALLIADAPLTAVVPAARITAGEIDQDTGWPAIVLVHQYTERAGNLAYEVGQELLRTSVEVIPLAKGYGQMADLATLIEAACHGKRGTFDGVTVSQCLRISAGADEFFDEQGLWARPIVFQVVYPRP